MASTAFFRPKNSINKLLATGAGAAAATTSRIRHAKYNATTITKEHFSTPLFCLHSLQVNCNFDCSRHTEQKKIIPFVGACMRMRVRICVCARWHGL